MAETYVYHVVTEIPMKLGQIIFFDNNHYNGVYNRVMACKDILDGKKPNDNFTKFINSNLEYWKVRAYRELALEKVRKEKYPNYPSRMSCLYTSKTLSDAEMWANSFINGGRKVYQIVKLRTDGKVFDGDAYNVFDGTDNAEENERNANCYWSNKPNKFGKEQLIETLVDGNIEVVEIVKEFPKTGALQ
ncbi:DUF2441 domain-containing protein [Cytobacillus solani]|uniref:DUF2441 domain-containing protein n=1 Tax=Cytobacillus solani TaxID=1637975 RepID=A0A0Q3QUE6_9BACI|nr:DUF2441 domain-containing protein [Cytobacillus solani]KOP79895.1 hypothetical protein AMS60_16230 [Bacillus sp. FJAT-21945]KQL21224.1 hypothetical protein AN957_23430 [Cytobacillus solani]